MTISHRKIAISARFFCEFFKLFLFNQQKNLDEFPRKTFFCYDTMFFTVRMKIVYGFGKAISMHIRIRPKWRRSTVTERITGLVNKSFKSGENREREKEEEREKEKKRERESGKWDNGTLYASPGRNSPVHALASVSHLMRIHNTFIFV